MATAAGCAQSFAVGQDGTLLVWGRGANGRLGLGDTSDRRVPTPLPGMPAPVRQVAAGRGHTGIVTDGGDLLMCGEGGLGQLGLGDDTDRMTATLLDRSLFDGDAVLMVTCGRDHTAVLTDGGCVLTFGWGLHGQLGHASTEDNPMPTRIPAARFNDERVVMLAAAAQHTVALSAEGHVFTWGYGAHGQLGHNDREVRLVPRLVDPGRFSGETVVFVATRGQHTSAVTAEGRLYTWGWGKEGQLGQGDTDDRLVPTLVDAGAFGGSRAVMAACGGSHTLVVCDDGALWASGQGLSGQLGLNDRMCRLTFARVGSDKFVGARIIAATAGFGHSAALTEDGELWTWGSGDNGRLGHGNVDSQLVPTMVAGSGIEGVRIGRCRALLKEHALAFAMGTHPRLGAAACAHGNELKEELVGMIARLSLAWPAGRAGAEEGMVRLLGGGAEVGRAMRAWPIMTLKPTVASLSSRKPV